MPSREASLAAKPPGSARGDEGRAQDVLAQVFATLLVVGGDSGGTLKVEAVAGRAQPAFCLSLGVGVEHDAHGGAFVRGAGGR